MGEAQLELRASRTILSGSTGAKQLAIPFPAGGSAEVQGRCAAGIEVELSGEIAEGTLVTACAGDAFALSLTPLLATGTSAMHAEQRDPGGAVIGWDDATLVAAPWIASAVTTGTPDLWSVTVEGTCNEQAEVQAAVWFSPLSVSVPCSAGSFTATWDGLTGGGAGVLVRQDIPCVEPSGCGFFDTWQVSAPGP